VRKHLAGLLICWLKVRFLPGSPHQLQSLNGFRVERVIDVVAVWHYPGNRARAPAQSSRLRPRSSCSCCATRTKQAETKLERDKTEIIAAFQLLAFGAG